VFTLLVDNGQMHHDFDMFNLHIKSKLSITFVFDLQAQTTLCVIMTFEL